MWLQIGSVATPGDAQGARIADTVAYVADFDSGLRVIGSVPEPAVPLSALAAVALLRAWRSRKPAARRGCASE